MKTKTTIEIESKDGERITITLDEAKELLVYLKNVLGDEKRCIHFMGILPEPYVVPHYPCNPFYYKITSSDRTS